MTIKQHLHTNLNLAVPVMTSQLGQVMVGVADSVMVGQLGPVPLAGAALGNAIFFFFMTFGLGVSFAITPMVAVADGEGNKGKCGSVLKHGFIINTLLSVVLFGIIAIANRFLSYFGQEPAVVMETTPYLLMIGYSILPFLVFQTFRQFAEGLSLTKLPMVVSVIANVLNVALNYVFIFGHFGVPAMGLLGAGIATLISRILMAVVMMAYVLTSKRFKVYWTGIRWARLDFSMIREILHIGVPAGLQFLFEIGAFGFSAIMMGWMGAKVQAAHQIAINLASITYMAASGLGAAAAIRVGNQLGRKDIRTMRRAAQTLQGMVILFMGLCALLFIIGRDFLPALYIDDPEVLTVASTLMIFAALFQLSDGVQVVGLGALRGMKDVKMPTVFTFIAYWVIALPLGYVLSFVFNYGPSGIWFALFIGLTVSAVLVFRRFNKMSKRLIAAG
jgi:MATE family multidrug resistance protein